MSILNYQVRPDRILVGADTLIGGGIEDRNATKLFAIPHAQLLLGGCGSMILLMQGAQTASIALGGLDQVATHLAIALEGIASNSVALARSQGHSDAQIPDLLGPQRFVLFGFSEKYQEMTAIEITRSAGSTKWLLEDDSLDSAIPWAESLGPVPDMDCESAFLMAARRQVEYTRIAYPGRPIGGNLVFAQLTRDELVMKNLGEIGGAT